MYSYTGLLSKCSGGIIGITSNEQYSWSRLNEDIGDDYDPNAGTELGGSVDDMIPVDDTAQECIGRFNIPSGEFYGLSWSSKTDPENYGIVIYRNVNGFAQRFDFDAKV